MRETAEHRSAFETYFRLGAGRSIERLREALAAEGAGRAPSMRTLYEWSRKLGWQKQIDELERQAREAEHDALVQEHQEMLKRQLQLALLLEQKGAEWLTEVDPARVTPAAAIRAIDLGTRLECELRVQPIDVETEIRRWAEDKDSIPSARCAPQRGSCTASRPIGVRRGWR